MDPVVIIGAPRSGTNMLRDWLADTSRIGTWPCDEINYIWRHGHLSYPSDAFTVEMATPAVRRYIRRQFQWVEERYATDIVLEKTCANCLRLPFVERVLGGPKYIFIYRNGVDAVASAMKRWRAELDLPYVLKKARFVPLSDLPYYAVRYAASRIYRLLSKDKRVSSWGPVLPNMDSLLDKYDLAEVCALQWKACVEYSLEALETIPRHRVFRLAYEDLVRDKLYYVSEISGFLGIRSDELEQSDHFTRMSTRSVGKGTEQLSPQTLEAVRNIVQNTTQDLGYQ